MIFFDWQYAYIGHPFIDFHKIDKMMSEEDRDEYLKLWSGYGSLERARKAYGIATKLGLIMNVWSLNEFGMVYKSFRNLTLLKKSATRRTFHATVSNTQCDYCCTTGRASKSNKINN